MLARKHLMANKSNLILTVQLHIGTNAEYVPAGYQSDGRYLLSICWYAKGGYWYRAGREKVIILKKRNCLKDCKQSIMELFEQKDELIRQR